MNWTSLKRSLAFQILPAVLAALVPFFASPEFWTSVGVPVPWPTVAAAVCGALIGSIIRALSPNALR